VLDVLGAKDSEKLSDFENNMLVACKCTALDRKNAGMVAFVPEYFARETEKRVQAERIAKVPPCHFGTVGQKVKAEKLSYLRSTGFDSAYGHTFVHSFQHAGGARIIWMTGTELDLSAGEEVNANFTVKAHDDYKGFPQTKVLRVKVWNDRLSFQ